MQSHRAWPPTRRARLLSDQQVRRARSPSPRPDTRPTVHVSSCGETTASTVVCAQPLHLSTGGPAAAPAGPLFGRLPSSTELPWSAFAGRLRSHLLRPLSSRFPRWRRASLRFTAGALRVALVCTLPLLSFGGELSRHGTSEQFRQRCPLSSGTPDEPSLGLTIRIVLVGPGPRLALGGGDRHGE